MELKDHKHKVSYSIGVDIGRSLLKNGTDVDVDVRARGMQDLLSGAALHMTDAEMKEVFEKVKAENAAKQYAKYEARAETNKQDGEAFLERHGREEGVIILPSGLQYRVLKEGSGRSPGPDDTVSVHYRGMFVDGREFDSSYGRGEPTAFPVKGVIKGWTEALQLMREGSHWKIAVPPDLAYGASGTPGGPIGPNQVLLFELEVLQIMDAAQGMLQA